MLEVLPPKGAKAGRPPVRSRRQLIDGPRFRTGAQLEDVPVEYGPWGRAYDLFRRWQRNGTWAPDPQPAPAPGRCEGRVRMGAERRLHGGAAPTCMRPGPASRVDLQGTARPGSAAIRRSSNQCWQRSACPASGRAGRAAGLIDHGPARRTPPARTAPTCAVAGPLH
ncbi:transposase, partial [Streptomyces sp. NPDC058427]|uniref:transposase n=1 Tax=Streptomyces sp. NPDC058427 TaxID=3346494 RepID=UPI00365E6437